MPLVKSTPLSVRQEWLDEFVTERDSFDAMLADDVFDEWDRNRGPQNTVEYDLETGLVLRYCQQRTLAER